jgi:rRNA maturation endonuclease Nob1
LTNGADRVNLDLWRIKKYVPDGTERCGYYKCTGCGSRFLDLRIAPSTVCLNCGEEPNMEIGLNEEMSLVNESAILIKVICGTLLSFAVTGREYNWI